MITARFEGTALTLQGHAGSAPYGQDLVCAAVSALVYALGQRLQELNDQGALEQPPVIELSSGNARICAVAKERYQEKVNEDFHLIYSGLKLLQTHYPEGIQIQDIPPLTAR